jgi:hypothetical protein
MLIEKQPKTFVIVLDNHPISEKQYQDCLQSANKYGWKIERFSAFYGNKLVDSDWQSIGVKCEIKKPGVKGCYMSHFHLWLKCISLNEPIVILEHDAVIQSPWPKLQLNSAVIKLHDYYKDPTSHKRLHAVTGRWSHSAHAYCLSPDHASILIKKAKEIGMIPVDVFLGDKIVDVVMHGSPELVSRQNTFSTTGYLQ